MFQIQLLSADYSDQLPRVLPGHGHAQDPLKQTP